MCVWHFGFLIVFKTPFGKINTWLYKSSYQMSFDWNSPLFQSFGLIFLFFSCWIVNDLIASILIYSRMSDLWYHISYHMRGGHSRYGWVNRQSENEEVSTEKYIRFSTFCFHPYLRTMRTCWQTPRQVDIQATTMQWPHAAPTWLGLVDTAGKFQGSFLRWHFQIALMVKHLNRPTVYSNIYSQPCGPLVLLLNFYNPP